MTQGKKKDGTKRKSQKGIKRTQRFRIVKCSMCGIDTECLHAHKNIKCWDCKMKAMKEYQHAHAKLKIYTNYAEAKGLQQSQQQQAKIL